MIILVCKMQSVKCSKWRYYLNYRSAGGDILDILNPPCKFYNKSLISHTIDHSVTLDVWGGQWWHDLNYAFLKQFLTQILKLVRMLQRSSNTHENWILEPGLWSMDRECAVLWCLKSAVSRLPNVLSSWDPVPCVRGARSECSCCKQRCHYRR